MAQEAMLVQTFFFDLYTDSWLSIMTRGEEFLTKLPLYLVD